MKVLGILGWVRDNKGKVVHRPLRDICPTITTFVGGGHNGNTTPFVLEIDNERI